MSDFSKVRPSHTRRSAFVYIRQSSPSQVENNRESTARQYALVEKACELGWAKEQVIVIDEDLGLSGSGSAKRSGFARMTAEVALGHVGIVLGLEVSRLARNNADWYRLLDLCGITDTLIGDSDGIYHPSVFNDRLILGLKGTMSEAELHILRARLDGGIRNKAARGELRRGLPIGFVWGEQDGEICFHPDESVVSILRTVFSKFIEFGSVRKVWLWFRSEGLSFPMRATMKSEIQWAVPTYTGVHNVLTNPVYAGAYAYGKCRHERYVDEQGTPRKRTRHLPMGEWSVLLPEHHPGFIDWATFQANQARIDTNVHPQPHQAGGAVREGAALLQGLATCGKCGRRLHTHYTGRTASPGYHCSGKDIVEGRGMFCMTVGGMQIDQAVVDAFLKAVTPAAIEATQLAMQQLEADQDAALSQWRLALERARYEAERAERQYRAVEPENRLVARGLETEWEKRLRDLATAKAELMRRVQQKPSALTQEGKNRLRALGADLRRRRECVHRDTIQWGSPVRGEHWCSRSICRDAIDGTLRGVSDGSAISRPDWKPVIRACGQTSRDATCKILDANRKRAVIGRITGPGKHPPVRRKCRVEVLRSIKRPQFFACGVEPHQIGGQVCRRLKRQHASLGDRKFGWIEDGRASDIPICHGYWFACDAKL
jgi:DNA invertase Pin-like site-specific DNA recombinase